MSQPQLAVVDLTDKRLPAISAGSGKPEYGDQTTRFLITGKIHSPSPRLRVSVRMVDTVSGVVNLDKIYDQASQPGFPLRNSTEAFAQYIVIDILTVVKILNGSWASRPPGAVARTGI